jgi:hypothetical protein
MISNTLVGAVTEKKDSTNAEGVVGRQRIFSTSLPKGRGDLIENAEAPPKEEESSIAFFFKMI